MGEVVNNKYLPNLGIRKKLINNYVMYYLPKAEIETNIIIRIVYSGRNMDYIWQE